MTIKEVSEKVGLSHQAIYKRLRNRGIKAADIARKSTGELTEEGERLMYELFPFLQGEEGREAQAPADEPAAAPAAAVAADEPSEVASLRDEVAAAAAKVAKLEGEVARQEEIIKALTDERDYLRGALERSQQLQALTAQKIPNPPPALTDGSGEKQRRGLWARLRGKGRGEA